MRRLLAVAAAAALLLPSWHEALAASSRSGVSLPETPAAPLSAPVPGPMAAVVPVAPLPRFPDAALPEALPRAALGAEAPPPALSPAAREERLEERVWARTEARFRETVGRLSSAFEPEDDLPEGALEEAAGHAESNPYSPAVRAAILDRPLRDRLAAKSAAPAARRLGQALESQLELRDLAAARDRQEQRGASLATAVMGLSMAASALPLLENPAASFLGVLFLTLSIAPLALSLMLLWDSRLTPEKRARLAGLEAYARRQRLFKSLAADPRRQADAAERTEDYRTPSPPPRARVRVRIDSELDARDLRLSEERIAELEDALLDEADRAQTPPRKASLKAR